MERFSFGFPLKKQIQRYDEIYFLLHAMYCTCIIKLYEMNCCKKKKKVQVATPYNINQK